MNQELPDVQAGFRKGKGTRNQIANICWIIQKAQEFQKNTYFFFIDYTKAFEGVDHNKLWKIPMGWDYQTTIQDQEATVRTRHGTRDWFKIGKGVCQGCVFPLCLFNFYAEHIIQNARLDKSQAGIKIAGRNINKLEYADDTTLMTENEEELNAN